jgi:hypothetical protein
MKEPPAGPVLHWVFKTATGGRDGIITNYQAAFDARDEGMRELNAERSEVTVVQLATKSVRMTLAMSMPLEGFVLKFPEAEVKADGTVKKPPRKKKT